MWPQDRDVSSTLFETNKMKVIALITCLATLVLADPYAVENCSSSICLAADGCRCSSQTSPITVSNAPQLITMTFSDAVTDAISTQYFQPLLAGRTNPDGIQIGATFYVPHEYTDYERVNQLYNMGIEIGVHSISKNSMSEYWRQASEDTLYDEFNGQREILTTFANIPIDDIVGARAPGFEMNGDRIFAAYDRAGIKYDNSWVLRSTTRYYPFTLHYKSWLQCQVGTCPTESFPNTWVLPVIPIVGTSGVDCNSISGCIVQAESKEDVKTWLMAQFSRHYMTNKAPLTLNINADWFAFNDYNYPGLEAFLDEVRANYDDVFFVDHKQVMDWIKNPVPASEFQTKTTPKAAYCRPQVCPLFHNNSARYMKTCTFCPDVYPWVGNPHGDI